MIQLGADFTSALPEILHRFCQRAVACFKGTCHRLRGAEGVYIGGVFAGGEAEVYGWLAQGGLFCVVPAAGCEQACAGREFQNSSPCLAPVDDFNLPRRAGGNVNAGDVLEWFVAADFDGRCSPLLSGFTQLDRLKKHENRRVDDPGFSVCVGRRRRRPPKLTVYWGPGWSTIGVCGNQRAAKGKSLSRKSGPDCCSPATLAT